MALPPIKGDQLDELCRRNGVARLRIFGSSARGDATESSDINLIADCGDPKTLLEIIQIEGEMTEAFGRPVDLLTEAAISPYIRDRIKDDLRVIYEAG